MTTFVNFVALALCLTWLLLCRFYALIFALLVGTVIYHSIPGGEAIPLSEAARRIAGGVALFSCVFPLLGFGGAALCTLLSRDLRSGLGTSEFAPLSAARSFIG